MVCLRQIPRKNVSVSRFQHTPNERWVGLVTLLILFADLQVGMHWSRLSRLRRSCGVANLLSPALLVCAGGDQSTLRFLVAILDRRRRKNLVRRILWRRIRNELLLLALFSLCRMLRLLATMCFRREALSFSTPSRLRPGGCLCTIEILRNHGIPLSR